MLWLLLMMLESTQGDQVRRSRGTSSVFFEALVLDGELIASLRIATNCLFSNCLAMNYWTSVRIALDVFVVVLYSIRAKNMC